MSEEQKVYVNGMIAKEHTFASTGNTIMKLSIKAADMIAFLNQHADERGWVNLGISRRKTPSDKGVTHTVWLDTWKPDPSRQRPDERIESKRSTDRSYSQPSDWLKEPKQPPGQPAATKAKDDDLPF